jgi:hypothetical protein
LKSGSAKKAAEYRFWKERAENIADQGLLFMESQINRTTG